MRRLVALIFGMALGAVIMWTALQYHVLRTRQGFVWVPKSNATLRDTYHDVRGWGITDWKDHSELTTAVISNGKTEVLADTNVLEATLHDALNVVK